MEEDIKVRVRIYFDGRQDPSMSIQEFNQLKATFQPYKSKLTLGDTVEVEGSEYQLVSISTEVLDETRDDHVKYGIEMARVGKGFPYNFEIEYFFEKK